MSTIETQTKLVLVAVITALIVSAIFLIYGYIKKKIRVDKIEQAKEEAELVIANAKKEIESEKREMLLQAKEEIQKEKSELDKEIKERRNELQRSEKRIVQKEETLDKKQNTLEEKEQKLNLKSKEIENTRLELEQIKNKQIEELEKISGLSSKVAREKLMADIEEQMKHEKAMVIKEYEAKIKEEADSKAREIITLSIQKCASDQVSETTVSVVPLPGDDMKGRIIGREGRNIRTLENLTGIDLIIDDTPEAVIISGFDPIRREVARRTLEKLITDGRIHPARIEEMVEKSRKEIEEEIKKEGETASLEAGVHGLHPELIKLLGRLKYRTSYGQNVLLHSLEVSRISGLMAGELGIDVTMAKRAGLLHDIGKAVDFEMEGSHVQIGGDLAKKYREKDIIINAIMAHHGDTEATSTIAVLVQAADAISAARPGARRETLENYIKRLEKLEEIANSFEGVEKTFAMQAGREIRIMVKPETVNDETSVLMARDIARRIESELAYPGQIKVNVIRETRATEYAK